MGGLAHRCLVSTCRVELQLEEKGAFKGCALQIFWEAGSLVQGGN